MKVKEMTELIRMPMSCAVSKSLEAARMAMPTFVRLMRTTSPTTSSSVRIGVMTVTRLVDAPRMVMVSVIHGSSGYCLGTPPVT